MKINACSELVRRLVSEVRGLYPTLLTSVATKTRFNGLVVFSCLVSLGATAASATARTTTRLEMLLVTEVNGVRTLREEAKVGLVLETGKTAMACTGDVTWRA